MGYIIAIIAAALMIGLDQWTKQLTITHLMNQSDISIIDGVFEITYQENRAAAFSMLQNKMWFLILFTMVVVGAIVFFYIRLPKTSRYKPLKMTLVMLLSGALGNFIDRIRIGYVVDMLHFYWFEFPVFNVADILIVISCFSLLLLMMFYYKEDELDIGRIIRGRHE